MHSNMLDEGSRNEVSGSPRVLCERRTLRRSIHRRPVKSSRYSFASQPDVASTFEIGRPTERTPYEGLAHLPTEVAVHHPAQAENIERPA